MSSIKPIKRVMLHSKAAEVIEKYIRDNNFKNGDKLPSERKLAEMLCIGRNSLREAIRTLEAMNLVEVINGKGIFVRNIDTSISINLKITMAKVNFLELLDIRRVLENYSIELAIKNASSDDIKMIEAALVEIERKYSEGLYTAKEDNKFHNAIYSASHNSTLYDLIKPLSSSFDKLWEPFGLKTELMMETLPLHRSLFEAIKNKNKRDAKRIFKEIMDMDERKVINFKVDSRLEID